MRRLALLVIALFLGVFFWGKQSEAVRAAPVRVPILLYHYVGNNPNPKDLQRNALSISPDKFEAEMAWLSQNGYTPITLDTLWGVFNGRAQLPAKPIVLTFDDGYIDFYTTVFPIIQKYGFHVVAFIPTGLVGGGYYMNWGQIKQLQASGMVSFEAHSITHAYLPSLSAGRLQSELSDSKNMLQSQINFPVNFVAYPFGAANGAVIAAAGKAGYAGGVGTWFGKAGYPSMFLPRIRVSGGWGLGTFAAVVSR